MTIEPDSRGKLELLGNLLKSVIFLVIAPGTVTVLLPYWILGPNRRAALEPGFAAVAGGLLLGAGAALLLWCFWGFARIGRGTPAPIDPPKELVIQGPYRFSRNPMYVAVTSILIGESILFRSTALLWYAAAIFVGFNLFILLYEEPTLRRTFGQSYERYRAAVPRWIGPSRH